MFPFVQIGPMRFGTYGIMMAFGLYCGLLMLRAEFRRRGIAADPAVIVLTVGVAGLIASKLYELVELPSVYLAHPGELLSTSGFAFYGAVFGGLGAVLLLSRHYRIPYLTLLDAVSPGAALGYGIGRVGCLLAGDGDYGIPTSLPWGMSFPHGLVPTVQRVHPTPIYEFLAAALIAAYLWRRGALSAKGKIAPGGLFAEYLLLTGAARFLVEFIRLNPRGWLGLTNAQQVAILSACAGVVLLVMARRTQASARRAP